MVKALTTTPVLDARDDLVAMHILVEVHGRRGRTEPMVSGDLLMGTGSTVSLRYLDDGMFDVVEVAEVQVLPAVPSEIKEVLLQAAADGHCPENLLVHLLRLEDGPFLTSHGHGHSQAGGTAAARSL